MRRTIVVVVLGLVALAAAVFALQQKFPNLPTPEVILENERVIVQRTTADLLGRWAGEHSHDGNQLVVFLTDSKTTYKEEGKDWQETRKAGEVMWVEATKAHDHVFETGGEAILITLK